MASGRRGGPPDLKSTLGSLLRTTLEHVSAVKDVVEQQARGRGGVVDQALLQRRRKEAFSRLGEAVYRLSERGMLGELALDPEIGMALADVEAASGEGEEDELHFESMARRSGAEAVSSANYRPTRASTGDKGEYRVWRPVMPEDDDIAQLEEAQSLEDKTPPPAVFTEEKEAAGAETEATKSPSAPIRMARRSALRGKGGGIQFVPEEPRPGDLESEDDLEGYMHEDDVPE